MSRFVRDSIWLTGASGIAAVANFLGQPALNYNLGPTGRGVLALVQSITGLAYELTRLGSTRATGYLAAKGEPIPALVSSDLLLAPISIVVSAATLLSLVLWTADSEAPVTIAVAIAMGSTVIIRSLTNAFSGPLAGRQHFQATSISMVLGALVLLACRWLLIPAFGVTGAFWAEAATIAASGGFVTIWLIRQYGLPSKPRREIVHQLLTYGVKSGFAVLASSFSPRLAPLLLYGMVSPAMAGSYTAVTVMVAPALVLPGVISSVLRPRSATMSPDAAVEQVGIVLRLTALSMLVACLVAFVSAWWLVRIIAGPEFLTAVSALQLYMFNLPLKASTSVLIAYLAGAGRPEAEASSALTGMAVTAIAGVTMIPSFGLNGAAGADLLGSSAALFLSAWSFTRRCNTTILTLFRPRQSDFLRLLNAFRQRRYPPPT